MMKRQSIPEQQVYHAQVSLAGTYQFARTADSDEEAKHTRAAGLPCPSLTKRATTSANISTYVCPSLPTLIVDSAIKCACPDWTPSRTVS